MSKYVRTENEIIYVGDLIKDEYGNYCDPKNYETDMEVTNEYIIKEADTIEKLCDEFVLFYNDIKQGDIPIPYATYERRGIWQKERENVVKEIFKKDRKAIIYGAIWTDKGLIYVAKMNEKGELE